MTNEKTEFDDKRFEDKLIEAAGMLTTAIAPERDLWPGIQASIDAPNQAPVDMLADEKQQSPQLRRGWRMPYFAQAAAVVLLVGASSAITYMVTGSNTTVSPVSVVSDSNELVLKQASFGGEFQLSAEYKLAHSGLQAQLNERLSRLPPESRVGVERNMELIRNAIAEINSALEQEPDNALLQGLLLDAYQEELAVMQKVGGLMHDVMSRNDI